MKLKWGICGCGAISHDFVCALQLLPSDNHQILGVASRSKEKANLFIISHELHDATPFGSYSDLLNNPEIDIVYIGLLNSVHKEIVTESLKSGKHVICEKPMGLNFQDTKDMIDTARASKKFLLEGYWSKFFPVYIQLKKEIEVGTIGKPRIMTGNFGFATILQEENKTKPELGGGSLMSIGCYLPMLALHVFQEMPISIKVNGFCASSGVDDTASISLLFSDNRVCNILYSGSQNFINNDAVIYGSNGKHLKIPDHVWCPTTLETPNKTFFFSLDSNSKKFNFPNSAGFQYEAEAARKAIMQGKIECEEMTHEDSLRLAKVLEICNEQLKEFGIKKE